MNQYLKQFVEKNFKMPGHALDLGAGDFSDVKGLEQLGWKCEGVDIKMGTDLEYIYKSKQAPFDLVYTNFVIHKLKNKDALIQTIATNMKQDGYFFIQTFDASDTNSTSTLTVDITRVLLKKYELYVSEGKVFDQYDDEEGHKHWHKILQLTGRRCGSISR